MTPVICSHLANQKAVSCAGITDSSIAVLSTVCRPTSCRRKGRKLCHLNLQEGYLRTGNALTAPATINWLHVHRWLHPVLHLSWGPSPTPPSLPMSWRFDCVDSDIWLWRRRCLTFKVVHLGAFVCQDGDAMLCYPASSIRCLLLFYFKYLFH